MSIVVRITRSAYLCSGLWLVIVFFVYTVMFLVCCCERGLLLLRGPLGRLISPLMVSCAFQSEVMAISPIGIPPLPLLKRAQVPDFLIYFLFS